MRKRVQKHVPNAITCANLFSGCVGIVLTLSDNPLGMHQGAYCIFLAAIFDFFDGFASRVLRATSGIGKDLDSLADMVSFGVLPSVILYEFFQQARQVPNLSPYLSYVAFLIPVFSALRLAKFNTDTRQAENFIGLPTPANAILIASLPLIQEYRNTLYADYITNPIILSIFVVLMCFLLVAELPLLSLKFKNTIFQENIYRYLLLLFSAILILFFKFAAVPVIIFLYIILSVIQFKINNDKVSSGN